METALNQRIRLDDLERKINEDRFSPFAVYSLVLSLGVVVFFGLTALLLSPVIGG